jgi:hypothetical protein
LDAKLAAGKNHVGIDGSVGKSLAEPRDGIYDYKNLGILVRDANVLDVEVVGALCKQH